MGATVVRGGDAAAAAAAVRSEALPAAGVLLRGGRYDALLAAAGLGERVAGGLSVYVNRLLAAARKKRLEP